jgi:hypothetical protein
MAGGADSGREVAIQSLKVERLELYQTLEALLRDRNFRFLCSIEGIYRDDLIALVKATLKPISRKDANDQISHWIQIGVFEVELREVEFLLPKQLIDGEKKKRKKPKGYEVIGETEDGKILLRTFKQFLVPSQELRAVCRVLEASYKN